MERWFTKIHPKIVFAQDRVYKKIERTVKAVKPMLVTRQLSLTFRKKEVDLNITSECLNHFGITRTLDKSKFSKCVLTNGIVTDMLKEVHSFIDLREMLSALSADPVNTTDSGVRKLLRAAEKKKASLARNVSRNQTWMSLQFFDTRQTFADMCEAGTVSNSSNPVAPPPCASAADWRPFSLGSARSSSSLLLPASASILPSHASLVDKIKELKTNV